MRKVSQQTLLMLLLVLMTAIAGCQGESPTAPAPSSGGGTGSGGGSGSGGGGTPPPTGSVVVVTLSNPNPLVLSTTQVTATVTVDGKPAPNGTAVEFSTDFGTFTDTNALTTIRTTTGGVASTILTATTAGTATVTVRVNNVNQRATVVFNNPPPPPPPPGGGGGGGVTFSVGSVSPATGRPSGGDIVVIRGTGFQPPVRVLFGTKEATVVSVTSTEIRVVVPPINLGGTSQFQDVVVTVINQAGTTSEAQSSSTTPFRYQVEILTPIAYTVSPASGPNEGNTRITIFGEGFQAPTRVFFGTSTGAGGLPGQVELEIISVTFSQIIAVTPPATGLGSNLINGQVALRVLNVATNKESVLPLAFRYGPLIRITAAGPTQGVAAGGTQVTIDGQGFDDPVAVTLAGIAATPIRVSGTQIVVVSGTPTSICASISGPVIVTNIEDGQTATGPVFTYAFRPQAILGLSPAEAAAGSSVTATVSNVQPGDRLQFKIGTKTVFATEVSPGLFSFVIPSTLVFDTAPCTTPAGTGTTPIPTAFDVSFTDLSTGCPASAVLAGALTVDPVNPVCTITTPTAPPTIASVTPNTGPVAGGTNVTISGSGFVAGSTVSFGGVAATNVSVVNSTTITATTPAHAAGPVNVTVSGSTGAQVLANGFTYM